LTHATQMTYHQSVMKDIDEAIRQKRAAVVRLQTEIQTLEQARALLAGGTQFEIQLHESGSQLDRFQRRKSSGGRYHPMQGKVNPKSSIGHTIAVLREAMMPLHIDEIVSRVQKRGGRVKKQSLVSTMAKMDKQGKVFARFPGPNTFGLLEWKSTASPTLGQVTAEAKQA
jgi:hypothetical protein